MKKHLTGFCAGILCTTIVFGGSITALAATGRMSIEIDPVNIKVNNEIFQPKDANGNDVMVFAYNGTTYAPLRALAEAYGLQVGWDQASGTATVVDPDAVQPTPVPDTPSSNYNWTAEEEAAYQEFKAMWELKNSYESPGYADINEIYYIDATPYNEVIPNFVENDKQIARFVYRMTKEYEQIGNMTTTIVAFYLCDDGGQYDKRGQSIINRGTDYYSFGWRDYMNIASFTRKIDELDLK